MALLHITSLYCLLPWLHFTVFDFTLLYLGFTSLYLTLYYTSTMALSLRMQSANILAHGLCSPPPIQRMHSGTTTGKPEQCNFASAEPELNRQYADFSPGLKAMNLAMYGHSS